MGTKPHELYARAVELAQRRHGIVTTAQLIALGASRKVIAGWAKTGRLTRLYRGVYQVGPFLTREGRWLAAVLACGESAVLSHRSAAVLHGIRTSDPRLVDVTVPTTGRRRRAGIAVHTTASLPSSERTTRKWIPITTVARTIVDLSAVLTWRGLELALDEVERLGMCEGGAVEATAAAHPGRRGTALLRAVLRDHRAGTTWTRNDLEEFFFGLCRAHDLPQPAANVPVGPYTADFLWREAKLIVETDGRGSHDTRAAFEHDRARDAWLTAAGWRVVRFTHRRLNRDQVGVARLLRRLLQQ